MHPNLLSQNVTFLFGHGLYVNSISMSSSERLHPSYDDTRPFILFFSFSFSCSVFSFWLTRNN